MKTIIRLLITIFIAVCYSQIAHKLGVIALIERANTGFPPSIMLMMFVTSAAIPAAVIMFLRDEMKWKYATALSCVFLIGWSLFLVLK